jgi:hypothetical protein
MKKITFLCGLVAAFLCFAQNANAQYLPNQIHRDGSVFVDEHHRALSDSELIDAVGIDIFEETVLGARKQYNAGRKLITGGAIGLGAGLVSTLAGTAFIVASGATYYEGGQPRYEIADEGYAIAGATFLALGISAMTAGSAALSAGIPLKVIGQSRLNWVENDYNERQAYTLHVGAAPHGIGLTLKF